MPRALYNPQLTVRHGAPAVLIPGSLSKQHHHRYVSRGCHPMTASAASSSADFCNTTSPRTRAPLLARPVPQLALLLPVYLLHVVFVAPLALPSWGLLKHGDADNLVAISIAAGTLVRAGRHPVRSSPPLPWARVDARALRPLILVNTSVTLCVAFLVSGYLAAGFELVLQSLLRALGLRFTTSLHHALQAACPLHPPSHPPWRLRDLGPSACRQCAALPS